MSGYDGHQFSIASLQKSDILNIRQPNTRLVPIESPFRGVGYLRFALNEAGYIGGLCPAGPRDVVLVTLIPQAGGMG
jgi:hypothetical protein